MGLESAKRILVYSHDTFGLGNIRRMLAICEHLIESRQDLSILLITGSPMIHGFRLPERLDYVKLPCLTRRENGEYSAKLLRTGAAETIELRSRLITCAAISFEPDIVLVDKKPLGVKQELEMPLTRLRALRPQTQHVLVLRDILDKPEATIEQWLRTGAHQAIEALYNEVLVLGSAEVFDIRREYRLPHSIASKVRFCGYTRRPAGRLTAEQVRARLGVREGEKLVLVTPGGGQDGHLLVDTYLRALQQRPDGDSLKSLVVHGPEMPDSQRKELQARASLLPNVTLSSFTEDMESHIAAADLVVSMCGYNTACEILSFRKRAIVVPRVRPVEEQWIRAKRFEALGLLTMLHPDQLSADLMTRAMNVELLRTDRPAPVSLDLDALPRVAARVEALFHRSAQRASQIAPRFQIASAGGRALGAARR